MADLNTVSISHPTFGIKLIIPAHFCAAIILSHLLPLCKDTILTPLVAGYSIYVIILLATVCECSVRLSVCPLTQKLPDQEI